MLEIRQINDNSTIGLLDLRAYSETTGIDIKRDLERAGTRFLLEQLLGKAAENLEYTEQKKPFLRGRTEHISISHSHDKLAVIINKKENTGIDIELLRDKVKNVRHKFLNANEMRFAGENTDRLITIWAAKEALYKVYGLKEVDFSMHLRIEEFENARIFGNIEMDGLKKRYELATELIDNYRMVYVVHEI